MACPSCGRVFWMTLPLMSHYGRPADPRFSCAAACGYFGQLASFSPAIRESAPSELDTHSLCNHCGVRFAVDGVIVRKPCCSIENPREWMAQAVHRVSVRLTDNPERYELETMLEFLVSTFDGTMRKSLEIANDNASKFEANDPNHPFIEQMRALPKMSSFQNLVAARARLLPTGWDMAAQVSDWHALVKLFQKRHTVAHRLGVVDQEYLDKTGDPTSTLGKRVALSRDEIINGAKSCHSLVTSFFGNFLS